MATLKMFLISIVALFLVPLLSANAQIHVPVLLWESPADARDTTSPASLSKMNAEEFADVLMRRLHGTSKVVVLFSEETLSVEDFSRRKEGMPTSFPSLQSMKEDSSFSYIPAVQTPLKALNRLSKLGYKWEQVSGVELPEAGKKILVVDLGDLKAGEDRSSMLLRHDKLIASTFKRMVQEYSEVLAIYTGRRSSWSVPEPSHVRARRDAEPVTASGASCNTVLSSAGTADQVLLYTSECPVLKINNTSFRLTSGDALTPDTRKGSQRMVVRYKLDNSSEKATLRFRFNFSENAYWQLTQAEYEDSNGQKLVLEPKSLIKASMDYSYSCGSETLFQNPEGTVTLKLKNIKVQPKVVGGVFAASEDCIGFFTIGIWSGLFVTFLLLAIVAWGIDMMMSIHTMDRFDDPKGKPLVFSAQE